MAKSTRTPVLTTLVFAMILVGSAVQAQIKAPPKPQAVEEAERLQAINWAGFPPWLPLIGALPGATPGS